MAWLLRRGEVLASCEVGHSRAAWARAAKDGDHPFGALLLRPCRSTHSIGLHFELDVAYLDGDLQVLDLKQLKRFRIGLPRRGAVAILQAEAGAFERWRLQCGDCLEIKD